MCFIAMRIRDWRLIMGTTSIHELISKHRVVLDSKYKWDYDQNIVTRAILDSGLCSLESPRHPLWKQLKLSPKVDFNRTLSTCFRGGRKYMDCNSDRRQGERPDEEPCMWYHFCPWEGKQHFLVQYHKILGTFENL